MLRPLPAIRITPTKRKSNTALPGGTGAIDEGDNLVQAMGETSLGEEDASGEGGDDLMDLGGMIGNKVCPP